MKDRTYLATRRSDGAPAEFRYRGGLLVVVYVWPDVPAEYDAEGGEWTEYTYEDFKNLFEEDYPPKPTLRGWASR